MSNSWYTVEYDENSIAWLVDDKKARLCLEHGMRLYVSGHLAASYQAESIPAPTESPAADKEG